MRTTTRPRRCVLVPGALVAAALLLTGCTDSLSDAARSSDSDQPGAADGTTGPFDSAACQAVRDGIEAYNAGDLEESVRAFDDALPLARSRADRIGGGAAASDAQALLEAVQYYAGLSAEQLQQAFPASPETQRFQITTLGQCQPQVPGVTDPDEQSA